MYPPVPSGRQLGRWMMAGPNDDQGRTGLKSFGIGEWNAAIQMVAKIGREAWEKVSGYRKQSRAEDTSYRYKQILGEKLKARDFDAQKRESQIARNVLNRMAELGMPESYLVAG